ncbi:MAG: hypothetical protein QXH96_00660 [Candidatus Geothermarchaeota archaeon]
MALYNEEELIQLILSKKPGLSREELESLINAKVNEKGVSKRTALYLILMDLNLEPKSSPSKYVKINQLTEGLSNVKVIGRILWLKEGIGVKGKRRFVKGQLIDDTGFISITLWDFDLYELYNMGIRENSVVEIIGGFTRRSTSNKIDLHLTKSRGKIEEVSQEGFHIPPLDSALKPLSEISSQDDTINVYGVVLAEDKERVVNIADRQVKVKSYIVGQDDVTAKLVLWGDTIDEYRWLKTNDKIAIFNGRVKISKFGEREIHLSKFSHILLYPSPRVNITKKPIKIQQIMPGFNINTLYSRVIAIGLKRYDEKRGLHTRSAYVFDGTDGAMITFVGDACNTYSDVKVHDVLAIENFRAIRRGDTVYIFVDECANVVINPKDVPINIPTITVPFRLGNEISLHDKLVTVEGRVVSIEKIDFKEFGVRYYILIQDRAGNPIRLTFKGDMKLFSLIDLNVGDLIRVTNALVDMNSLISPPGVPRLMLRAYSTIMKVD